MTRVVFSALAAKDLEAVGDYIARDDPAAAVAFVRRLREQCETIAASPKAWRLRPELGQGLRSCPLGNYVIFYTENDSMIFVVRVLHGAMDTARRL